MFNAHVVKLQLEGKAPRIQFVEKRTLNQNDMSFAIYKQVSVQISDQSVNDIRAECKLTIGVGLLRADDEQFMAFYDAGLKKMTYEQKLLAMVYVPVTSLMRPVVFSEYLDEMIRKYSQQGISLIRPREEP